MKKCSFLLMLTIASAPLHAKPTDTAEKVIKSTVKSNKLSDKTKKIIGGVVGSISALLLIAGSVYGYKKYKRRQNNNLRKPLLTEWDEGCFSEQKTKQLVLLLRNGKSDDKTFIAAIQTLIKDGADPNGLSSDNSIFVALETKKSLAVLTALVKNGAIVSHPTFLNAQSNGYSPEIIRFLKKNKQEPQYPVHPYGESHGNLSETDSSDPYALDDPYLTLDR